MQESGRRRCKRQLSGEQKQWYDFQTKKRKDADRKRVERHRKRFEEEALANGQERPAGGDKKEFAPQNYDLLHKPIVREEAKKPS